MMIKKERGRGKKFNTNFNILITKLLQFNDANKIDLICRSHQLVMDGYKWMFKKRLISVWSGASLLCAFVWLLIPKSKKTTNTFASVLRLLSITAKSTELLLSVREFGFGLGNLRKHANHSKDIHQCITLGSFPLQIPLHRLTKKTRF
jgi:hypothetical protein